jgi:uncharacterized protein YbaP (TraB family)
MRLRSALSAFLIALLPVSAGATCDGRNLLPDLTEAERATLDAALAEAPFPSGNRWRATRGTSVIDLVGTFHLYDPRMDAIAARLEPAIAGADAVYVEATEKEFKALQAEIGRNPGLLISDGPTLPELLTPAEWQSLSEAMRARQIPPFMAAKFRPWYVAMMLGLPACAMAEMAAAGKGLDGLVMKAAERAGKPLLPLEPHDTLVKVFELMNAEDQIDMIRASLPLAAKSEDMFATLVAAYYAEDHRMIWELTRMTALNAPGTDPAAAAEDFALMEETLLDARNRAWMDVILPAAEGRHIVVAFGAAHLSGPEGVLNLLAEDGWTLERQAF